MLIRDRIDIDTVPGQLEVGGLKNRKTRIFLQLCIRVDFSDDCAVAFEEREVAVPSVAFLTSQAVTVLGSVLKDGAQGCFGRAAGVLENGSSVA